MPIIVQPIQPGLYRPLTDAAIDEDSGGAGNFLCTENGVGLAGVQIRLYLTAEYDADPKTAIVRGSDWTDADGRWHNGIFRNPRLPYTLIFIPPNGAPIARRNLPAEASRD